MRGCPEVSSARPVVQPMESLYGRVVRSVRDPMANRSLVFFVSAVSLGAVLWVASSSHGRRAADHPAIDPARMRAEADNQRVAVVLLGGATSIAEPLAKALRSNRGLRRLLAWDYELTAQPAESVAGRSLREQLGVEALPALAVLSSDGVVLGTLEGEQMMEGQVFVLGSIRRFLEAHRCEPVDARAVFSKALVEAQASGRRVLTVLTNPENSWGEVFLDFLAGPSVNALISKDYVIVTIDVERMIGGASFARELRDSDREGLPWLAILDEAGQRLATSDGPKGNIGGPVADWEIDHFMAMVDETRQHMTDVDRRVFERELRAHGARSNPPGATAKAYRGVIGRVATGDFEGAVELLGALLERRPPSAPIQAVVALRPLRDDPDRRLELVELCKQHPSSHGAVMIDLLEPGQRVHLEGRIVDAQSGAPLSNALVKLTHADAGGEYRRGDDGEGLDNPRLWCFVRADADGRFRVETVLPGRLRGSSRPRCAQFKVWAEGYPEAGGECFFDADPPLDRATREDAQRRGIPVLKLEHDSQLRAVARLTIHVASE